MKDKYLACFFFHNKADYVLPHQHDKFEIIYYATGKGTTVIGDEQYKYEKDNLIVIPPNIQHDEYATEQTEVLYCSVDKTYNLVDRPLKIALDESNAEKMHTVKRLVSGLVGVKSDEIMDSENNQILLEIIVTIAQLFKEKDCKHKEETKKIIELAKTYISKNFNYRINYVLLAEKVGYSYDRFRHLFYEYYGKTVKDYEMSLKLPFAQSLLAHSDDSVNKIAVKCGFKNSNRFCNWFQKEMGMSALQYKKIVSKDWFFGICNISTRQRDSVKNIIVDTDLGCDCDDAGALALIDILYNLNEVNVLCETHCLNDESGCLLIDKINAYYGTYFDIGVAQESTVNAAEYYNRFVYKLVGKAPEKKNYRDAVEVISAALEKVEDNSVTVTCIGQLNNIARLLTEKYELVKKKVKKIVVMGGCFAKYDEVYQHKDYSFQGEFNIATDVASAKKVVAVEDIEIHFVDYNCGADILTGKVFEKDENNPVNKIYRLNKTPMRPSWDLVAVLYASEIQKEFFNTSDFGTVEITDTGKTIFTNKQGKHKYVELAASNTEIAECLEKILQLNLRNKIAKN